MNKPLYIITLATLTCLLNSCALASAPVKVASKVATTSIGLAGKAAGAGIDAMRSKD
jgi:hypothetical protein